MICRFKLWLLIPLFCYCLLPSILFSQQDAASEKAAPDAISPEPVSQSQVRSLAEPEKLGIGLGYPYICVKYNFIPAISSEIKYATGDGVNVIAGRLYWNFLFPIKGLNIFTGMEYGAVIFNETDMSGTGTEASLFVGGEYFLADRFSFHMDLGPSAISLKNESAGVEGVEWIANLALYYYIF